MGYDLPDNMPRERSRQVEPTSIHVFARRTGSVERLAWVLFPHDDCDMRTFYTEGNAGAWEPLEALPSMPSDGHWVFVGTVTHTETTGGPYPGASHIRFAGSWRAASEEEARAIDYEIENA